MFNRYGVEAIKIKISDQKSCVTKDRFTKTVTIMVCIS